MALEKISSRQKDQAEEEPLEPDHIRLQKRVPLQPRIPAPKLQPASLQCRPASAALKSTPKISSPAAGIGSSSSSAHTLTTLRPVSKMSARPGLPLQRQSHLQSNLPTPPPGPPPKEVLAQALPSREVDTILLLTKIKENWDRAQEFLQRDDSLRAQVLRRQSELLWQRARRSFESNPDIEAALHEEGQELLWDGQGLEMLKAIAKGEQAEQFQPEVNAEEWQQQEEPELPKLVKAERFQPEEKAEKWQQQEEPELPRLVKAERFQPEENTEEWQQQEEAEFPKLLKAEQFQPEENTEEWQQQEEAEFPKLVKAERFQSEGTTEEWQQQVEAELPTFATAEQFQPEENTEEWRQQEEETFQQEEHTEEWRQQEEDQFQQAETKEAWYQEVEAEQSQQDGGDSWQEVQNEPEQTQRLSMKRKAQALSSDIWTSWPALGEDWPLPNSSGGRSVKMSTAALRQLPVAARRAVGGCRPSRAAVKVLCESIGRVAALGEAAVLPLQRLYAWLWTVRANAVQEWMHQVAGFPALVAAMTCPEPHGRAVALWACHVVGLAARNHDRNAAAMAEAGVTASLCGLIERHPRDMEIQVAATTALTYLVQCSKVQQRLSASDAIRRLLAAVESGIPQ